MQTIKCLKFISIPVKKQVILNHSPALANKNNIVTQLEYGPSPILVKEFNRTLYIAPVVRVLSKTDVVVAFKVILANILMALLSVTFAKDSEYGWIWFIYCIPTNSPLFYSPSICHYDDAAKVATNAPNPQSNYTFQFEYCEAVLKVLYLPKHYDLSAQFETIK